MRICENARSSLAGFEPTSSNRSRAWLLALCVNLIRSGLFRTANDPGGGGVALKAPLPLRSRKLFDKKTL